MSAKSHTFHRVVFMAALILAGEAVFALPFHIARFFRPTVLELFSLTATELGAAQGMYGVLAMLAYVPGGPLADRFPARKLLAVSLWSTAAGGLYMATFPGYRGAVMLWGFFGITTILLFWAALIRATRDWGGHDEQGRAYGMLDGGRGLLASVLATIAVAVFGFSFPEGYASATLEQKQDVMRQVIYGYTAVTAAVGVFVWFAIADGHPTDEPELEPWQAGQESVGAHFVSVMRLPAVWLQALIVVCAYVGYKGFDNLSLYFVEGVGMDQVEAARLTAIGAWMRPVACIAAGFLADRFSASRIIVLCFAMLMLSDLYFALGSPQPGIGGVLLVNTLIGCSMFFALRGVYFALFEEAKVPAAVTGTAVGVVSVIGFMPEIFVAYVAGVLVDRTPGLAGHQHFYMFLAAFAFLGLLISLAMARQVRR